jgi:hypothetical protein
MLEVYVEGNKATLKHNFFKTNFTKKFTYSRVYWREIQHDVSVSHSLPQKLLT